MSNRVFCRKHDPDGHANWDTGFRPLLDDTCFMCATEQLNQQLQQAHAELASYKAGVEVERFKHKAEQNSTKMCKWMEKYNKARQEAARECIEAIEYEHGILGLAFTLRQRFKLEG